LGHLKYGIVGAFVRKMQNNRYEKKWQVKWQIWAGTINKTYYIRELL